MPTFKQFRLPDVGEGLTEAEILQVARQARRRGHRQPDDRRDRDGEGGGRAALARSPGWSPSCWSPRARPSTSARRSSPSTSTRTERPAVPPTAAGARPEDLIPTAARRGGGRAGADRRRRRRAAGPRSWSATGRGRSRPSAGPASERPPAGAGVAAAQADAGAGRGRSGRDGRGGSASSAVSGRGGGGAGRRRRAGARGAGLERARCQVLAKPPVRKLARDLGVDLGTVTGSGDGGVITRADVEAAARPASPSRSGARLGDPCRATWDATREQRIPIKGVRKHTAAAMVASAFTAPHVTECLTVDITATMQLRDRVAASPEFAGVKVSPLLFVARALLLAVRAAPDDQLDLGRAGPGDRGQALRQPRHRRGHPARPDRAERQGRRPAVRCASWPRRSRS